MSLATNSPIAFIPTQQPEAARHFYEQTLGLKFVADNDFAIVFRVGPEPQAMLRIVRARNFVPVSHTIFGWEVENVEQSVDELLGKGIQFLRPGYFEQDARNIWNAPDGSRIAWFQDPDGNTLSISEHPAGETGMIS